MEEFFTLIEAAGEVCLDKFGPDGRTNGRTLALLGLLSEPKIETFIYHFLNQKDNLKDWPHENFLENCH